MAWISILLMQNELNCGWIESSGGAERAGKDYLLRIYLEYFLELPFNWICLTMNIKKAFSAREIASQITGEFLSGKNWLQLNLSNNPMESSIIIK